MEAAARRWCTPAQPRVSGVLRPAVLRFAARQIGHSRERPPWCDQPNEPGSGVIRDHRHRHRNSLPADRDQRSGISRGKSEYALAGEEAGSVLDEFLKRFSPRRVFRTTFVSQDEGLGMPGWAAPIPVANFHSATERK